MYILINSTLPHTKKKNLDLHATSLFYHTLPCNVTADRLRNYSFLALPKFGNTKELKKSLLNNFPCSLELRMYCAPLTWFEQENLGHKAHFEIWSQSTVVFACFFVVIWNTETLRRSYKPVLAFTNP